LSHTFFKYFDKKHDMAELVAVLKLDEYTEFDNGRTKMIVRSPLVEREK